MMPVLAVANAVAFLAVLRARWFLAFFDLWRVPAGFLLFGVVLGLVCWLISLWVDGWFRWCAVRGAVLCGCVSVVVAVLWLVWVLVIAVIALFAFFAVWFTVFRDDFLIFRFLGSAFRGSPSNGRSSRARNRR